MIIGFLLLVTIVVESHYSHATASTPFLPLMVEGSKHSEGERNFDTMSRRAYQFSRDNADPILIQINSFVIVLEPMPQKNPTALIDQLHDELEKNLPKFLRRLSPRESFSYLSDVELVIASADFERRRRKNMRLLETSQRAIIYFDGGMVEFLTNDGFVAPSRTQLFDAILNELPSVLERTTFKQYNVMVSDEFTPVLLTDFSPSPNPSPPHSSPPPTENPTKTPFISTKSQINHPTNSPTLLRKGSELLLDLHKTENSVSGSTGMLIALVSIGIMCMIMWIAVGALYVKEKKKRSCLISLSNDTGNDSTQTQFSSDVARKRRNSHSKKKLLDDQTVASDRDCISLSHSSLGYETEESLYEIARNRNSFTVRKDILTSSNLITPPSTGCSKKNLQHIDSFEEAGINCSKCPGVFHFNTETSWSPNSASFT